MRLIAIKVMTMMSRLFFDYFLKFISYRCIKLPKNLIKGFHASAVDVLCSNESLSQNNLQLFSSMGANLVL